MMLISIMLSPHAISGIFCGDGYLGDGMVIQREEPFPIHGSDTPGQTVILSGFGMTLTTETSSEGKWAFTIPAQPAGAISDITVSGNGSIQFKDVIAGDVYFFAGQSNLALSFSASDNWAAYSESWDAFPTVRIYNQPRVRSEVPAESPSGIWQPFALQNVNSFSAVATYFAQKLHLDTDIPLGIIVSAWGSSQMKSWFPLQSIQSLPHAELEPYTTEFDRVALSEWSTAYRRYLERKRTYPPGLSPRAVPIPVRPHTTGDLYHSMVHPFTMRPVKAVIYYQGEAEVYRPHHLEKLFPWLISSWREAWNQPDLPFFFVQLPGWDFGENRSLSEIELDSPIGSFLPALRDAQRNAFLNTPDTSMVVAFDLGDKDDAHPADKMTLAHRLVNAAKSRVYGHDILWKGPSIISQTYDPDSSQIKLQFKDVGSGLTHKGNDIKGFFLAGMDGVFVPAQAQIVSPDTITLITQEVPKPQFLVYGWKNFPLANLYDSQGNPASPFRLNISP